MAGHKYVDNLELTWRENREDVAVKVRQLGKRVLNELLKDLDQEFLDAAAQGQVLSIDFTRDEIRERMWRVTQRVLAPGEVIRAED